MNVPVAVVKSILASEMKENVLTKDLSALCQNFSLNLQFCGASVFFMRRTDIIAKLEIHK